MIVRLLMHPVAENVLICLSVGLTLLCIGLVGSLLWAERPIEDVMRPAIQVSQAEVVARAPVLAPESTTSLACLQYSGFVSKASLIDCKP